MNLRVDAYRIQLILSFILMSQSIILHKDKQHMTKREILSNHVEIL